MVANGSDAICMTLYVSTSLELHPSIQDFLLGFLVILDILCYPFFFLGLIPLIVGKVTTSSVLDMFGP